MTYPSITKLFLAALMLIGCNNDPKPLVASGDSFQISLSEFRTAYLQVMKQPNTYDTRELREKFLDELILRRLLHQEAEKSDLAEDEQLQYMFNAYTGKLLRDIHYKIVIEPEIIISERELRTTFVRLQESRRIRHLFSKDSTEIQNLYQSLVSGVAFDLLAARSFADSQLAHSGGDLGWLEWDQLDYRLAEQAWQQELGEFSPPVKAAYGWHILQVTDFRKGQLLSEEDFQNRQQHTRSVLKLKKGEVIAGNYIQDLMATKQIVVYPDIVQLLSSSLSLQITRQPSRLDATMPIQISQQELERLSGSVWDHRDKILAELGDRQITVAEFVYNLQFVPYYATYRSFKQSLDFVLRDVALTEDALALGINKYHPAVREKLELYKDYHLQLALRRKIRRASGSNDEAREKINDLVGTLRSEESIETNLELLHKHIDQIIRDV